VGVSVVLVFTLLREAEKAPPVKAGMNEGVARSLGEGGYASEGSARRKVWSGTRAVKPWGSTVPLLAKEGLGEVTRVVRY